jgi:hypothetical protein
MANSTDQSLFRYIHHTYRDGGVSLHPLQRAGQVSASGSESWFGRGSTFLRRSQHFLDSVPARETVPVFPQVVPLV